MADFLIFLAVIAALVLGWSSMGVEADEKKAGRSAVGYGIIGLLFFAYAVAGGVHLVTA